MMLAEFRIFSLHRIYSQILFYGLRCIYTALIGISDILPFRIIPKKVTFLINNVVRLKVGSKGEIFTTKEIRDLLGLKPSSEVIAIITKDGLLIKPRRSLKSLLKKRKIMIKMSIEEFESLSEEIQREMLGEG